MGSLLGHLPGAIIAPVASLFIPAFAGYLAHILMNYVDDAKQWTAKLPDDAKRLLVATLAAAVVALNQQYGLSIPTDGSLLTEPGLQSVLATAIALFLKHSHDAKVHTAVVEAAVTAEPVVVVTTPSVPAK